MNNLQPAVNSLESIPFDGDTIFLFDHNGEPYVPVRPICENIGVDWKRQREKIQAEKERFNWGLMPSVAQDGKEREMVCLPLRKIAAWLFTISPSKVAPNIKNKLIRYQNDCDEVLWNYWTKGVGLTNRKLVNKILVDKDEFIELQDISLRWHRRQLNPAGGPIRPEEAKRLKADILNGMTTTEVARKHGRSTAAVKKHTVEERRLLREKSGVQLKLFSAKQERIETLFS